MLQAHRHGMFKQAYEIAEDGRPVTVLDWARREGCAFDLDGARYEITRDGRRHFVLSGQDVRLSADRETGRRWTITGGLAVVRPSFWRSHWELERDGRPSGTIRHDGGFKRTYTADLPRDLPLPVRLLVFHVVLTQYERTAAAAAT